MLITTSRQALKGMLPQIHQPLPLNQREAQQLLNALTSSFRRNLDREHGWLPDHRVPSTTKDPTSTASTLSFRRRPTDRHLQTILSNPLFNYKGPHARQTDQPGNKRDPIEVFDEGVARGLMTIERATGILIAIRRDIKVSPALLPEDEMRSTGAGLKVWQWIRTSGLERDLSFLHRQRFIETLLPFMVAEGLEPVAWEWLRRLAQAEEDDLQAARFLVRALIFTTLEPEKNFDGAYGLLSKGAALLNEEAVFKGALLPTWLHLSWNSTVNAWKRPNPSVDAFERFIQVGEQLGIPAKGTSMAHLDLHHPTTPSATSAVRVLTSMHRWNQAQGFTNPDNNSRRVISMGLDAVQHLTRIGDMEMARRVLGFLNLGHESRTVDGVNWAV